MKLITLSSLVLVFAIAAFPQKYRIAYNVLVDKATDNYDVFSMKIDGSDKKNITNNPDVAWTYYAWEDRLFFVSDRGACKRCYFLHEMKADGTGVKKLSDLRLEDSWMGSRFNGKEMVVTGRIGTDLRYQLFIIDLATGKYRQITDEKAAAHRDPSFSPDGKQIIYVYKKERTNRQEYEDLYIMNADGTNKRRLTTYPADDKTSQWHDYHAGPPRWVKKHGFITYQSVQKGKSSLYAVTPDGKRQWKLTNNELAEGWHDWSPDGKWLVIEMSDKDNTEYSLHLMNWKTKEVKKLTNLAEGKYNQSPVFIQVK